MKKILDLGIIVRWKSPLFCRRWAWCCMVLAGERQALWMSSVRTVFWGKHLQSVDTTVTYHDIFW